MENNDNFEIKVVNIDKKESQYDLNKDKINIIENQGKTDMKAKNIEDNNLDGKRKIKDIIINKEDYNINEIESNKKYNLEEDKIKKNNKSGKNFNIEGKNEDYNNSLKNNNILKENENEDSIESEENAFNNIKEKKENNYNDIVNNFNLNTYNNKREKTYNKNGYIPNFELTNNIGFSNIGHTCYMNSFLQILLHSPSFLPKLKKINTNINQNTLIYNLIKLSEYPNNTKYLYEIKKIMSNINPKYGEFAQNDTQIFAIDFIDTMINEIKNEISYSSSSSQQEENISSIEDNRVIKIKKFNKFISDIEKIGQKTFIEEFFSFIEYSIKYKDDLIDINKIRFNLLLNIELTFPVNLNKNSYSIYELLDNKYTNNDSIKKIKDDNKEVKEVKTIRNKKEESFFYKYFNGFINTIFGYCLNSKIEKEEEEEKKNIVKLNHNNKIKIITNNNFSELTTISKIANLPNILIISIDRGIEGKELISSCVSFEEKLELKNYIDKDLYNINLGTTYKLYGINIRQGSTKYSGHCYSFIKIGNDWFCFNDSYAHSENPKYCLNSVVGLYYIKENL